MNDVNYEVDSEGMNVEDEEDDTHRNVVSYRRLGHTQKGVKRRSEETIRQANGYTKVSLLDPRRRLLSSSFDAKDVINLRLGWSTDSRIRAGNGCDCAPRHDIVVLQLQEAL